MSPEGRELSAFLAERLMGWYLVGSVDGPEWSRTDGSIAMPASEWDPASRWDHAGMVAEAMRQWGWLLTLDDFRTSWQALYMADMEDDASQAGVEAPTAPRAIAEAARAALEGEQ